MDFETIMRILSNLPAYLDLAKNTVDTNTPKIQELLVSVNTMGIHKHVARLKAEMYLEMVSIGVPPIDAAQMLSGPMFSKK